MYSTYFASFNFSVFIGELNSTDTRSDRSRHQKVADPRLKKNMRLFNLTRLSLTLVQFVCCLINTGNILALPVISIGVYRDSGLIRPRACTSIVHDFLERQSLYTDPPLSLEAGNPTQPTLEPITFYTGQIASQNRVSPLLLLGQFLYQLNCSFPLKMISLSHEIVSHL
jgi:hypothetical protein